MSFAKAYSGMKSAAARALILGVCGLGLAGCDTLSSLNPFEKITNKQSVHFTSSGYGLSLSNPVHTESFRQRLMATVSLVNFGSHNTGGFNLQTTANPSKNWRFQANYAFIDAVEENLFLEWKAWHAQNSLVAHLRRWMRILW